MIISVTPVTFFSIRIGDQGLRVNLEELRELKLAVEAAIKQAEQMQSLYK